MYDIFYLIVFLFYGNIWMSINSYIMEAFYAFQEDFGFGSIRVVSVLVR